MEMKKIAGLLVVVGVLFFGASWYVSEQQSEYVAQIKLFTAEQETTLATLAQTIDRDGADAVVSSLILDCEPDNRKRFDELLASLDSLSRTEIQEVDGLFDACGDYFAQRRAVMVARLEREFEVYRDYVELIKITDKRAPLSEYPVEKWTEVVELEKQRSQLSIQLVRIQDEIITSLLKGVAPGAEEIRLQVTEASEVKDTLSYTGVRIDEIREDAIGL